MVGRVEMIERSSPERPESMVQMFLNRFREGTLTSDDLDRFFIYVMLPFWVGPSFLSVVLIDGETGLGDMAIKLGLGIFFVPLFLGFLLLGSYSLPKKPSIQIKVLRTIGALVFAAVFSFLARGYFSLGNALTSSREPVLVSGTVLHMKAEGARWLGREYLVTIQHGGRAVELSILPQEYATLKPGDTYGNTMKLGGLGYYYSWGLAFWKNLQDSSVPLGQER